MQYVSKYSSPVGEILIISDDVGITGARLGGDGGIISRHDEYAEKETPFISQTKRWFDIYFDGKEPDFTPPLHPTGTPFQTEIWDILRTIPYGRTTTYGAIAKELAARHGIKKMSAQAVGSAVGHNKIAVIIPCHRVIGADGSLTGYAGGIDKKAYFLELEGVYDNIAFPRLGRATE